MTQLRIMYQATVRVRAVTPLGIIHSGTGANADDELAQRYRVRHLPRANVTVGRTAMAGLGSRILP